MTTITLNGIKKDGTRGGVEVEAHEMSPGVYSIASKLGAGDLTTDAWGTPKVVNDFSLFHGLFTFDVPPSMWLIEENSVEVINSASTKVTSIGGRLNVTSGATAGDKAQIESRRHPRYQPDRGLKYAASLGFKGASLDGILKAGLIVDGENGVYFKTIGDGSLYACVLNDGVETHSEKITFPFEIDITKGNIYDIRMQWRGVGNISFFAGNPSTGFLEEVHEIKFLNVLDEKVSIRNPALSLAFHAENITQEVSLWCGCADVSSEGGGVEREQYGEFSVGKTSSGGDPILALRVPNLAPNGKINTRDLRLVRITISADKRSIFKVYQTRDATAVTGGTWATVQTGSFVEANTAMSAIDTAKMDDFSTFRLAPNESISRDNPAKDTIDFYGVHGDYIAIVCDTGSTVIGEFTVEWGEEI